MFYTLLGKLFKSDVYDTRYTPKPYHVFYSLLLMAVGTVTFIKNGWAIFGVCTFILGFLMGIIIELAINWDKMIEYWYQINEHVNLMMKVKDPDIWQALGYKHAPQSIQVIEQEDMGQGFITTRIKDYKLPATTLNTFANKVLNSGKTIITANEYSKIIPNFRKIQSQWKKDGYLKQVNPKNPRLGYSLTKKGMDMVYQFASDSIKLKEKE